MHRFIIDINTIIFVALIDYIWADRRTSDILFFAKLSHIIHAYRRTLNISFTCPHVRMVIHLISTSILTWPYITNYDLTYLQHFAIIMHEYWSGSELKPCNMVPDAHTCARNILKERTELVEAKLASSKWTNPSRVLFEVWFLPSVYFRHVHELHFINSLHSIFAAVHLAPFKINLIKDIVCLYLS